MGSNSREFDTRVKVRVRCTGLADIERVYAGLGGGALVHSSLNAMGIVDGLARS
jgi:hypothetical protein